MTADDLLAFEADIAAEFNAGRIRAPVHLYDGNEDAIIRYFETVNPEDWICCSWRSHYQCLLHGVPPEELKAAIMEGRSIALCFPQHRIISSAIVGGIIPIALGVAMAVKRVNGPERVHCFMGEMTAETGIAHECFKFAHNWDLPISFVVEDNGKSVCTDTRAVWAHEPFLFPSGKIYTYRYESKFPHAGAGLRVQF